MTALRDDLAADELVREIVRDILPQVTMGDLFSSFILPATALSRAPFTSARQAWSAIREKYPRGAAFPLGIAAERAVRRTLLRSPRDLVPELARECLFELVMLDLRGSSETLNRDYGFWYHWRPDGQFRSLAEERELRARIHDSCSRKVDELRTHLPPGAGTLTDAAADHALRQVFQAGPAKRRARADLHAFTALGVHVAGADKRQNARLSQERVEIVLHGPGRNVRLHDEQLVAACGGSIDDRLRDLLDIATFFYFADIYVPRNVYFARELVLSMPVRSPKVWQRHRQALERVCSFLTGNNVSLRFTPLQDAPKGKSRRFRITDAGRAAVLFSGGLDSFAGAAAALGERSDAVLVSHSASPMLTGMQRKLFEHFGAKNVVQARTEVLRDTGYEDRVGQLPDQELYQHGRSLLFLSLATAVALSNGMGRVRMYENGPVALNALFSEARFNTRTAHPLFLRWFEELVNEVFETGIRIENPFELLTKGEVVATLGEEHHLAIAATNSCWRYARVKTIPEQVGLEKEDFEGRHCGLCVPCFWRRAAVKAAGLAELDDQYLWDVVPDREWNRFLKRKEFTVLLDLYRAAFASEEAEDDRAMLELFPDLDEIGPGTLDERLDLHRRHASELMAYFDEAKPRLFYRLPEEGASPRPRSSESPA